MKAAVVRPTKAYLQKTSMFLRYHIAVYNNMLQKLFPAESKLPSQHAQDRLTTTEPQITKREDNVLAVIKEIDSNSVLPLNLSSDTIVVC